MTFGSRLDDDCCRYLEVRRLGVTQRAIALYLDWDEQRAEAVRKRIDRHKQNQAALKQYYSTATRPGRDVFSLHFPPMSANLEFRGEHDHIAMNEQLTALDQARLRLDDLVIQSRSANAHVAEIEGRISQLQTDIERDGTDAVLDGRALDKSLSKQLDAAIGELKTARHLAKSHQLAVAKVEATVGRLEDELHARRFELFSKAIAGPQSRLDKAVTELMAAAVDVADIAQLHGFQQSHTLVSRGELNDDVLGRLVSVVRTALQAAHFWETYYDNAPKFHQANHPRPFVITQRAIPADPIQQHIHEATAKLVGLNERLQPVMHDMAEADREATVIRYSYRNIGNGFAPPSASDQKEIGRLLRIVEQKMEEEKQIQAARKKLIEEVIPGLNKELHAKRVAA